MSNSDAARHREIVMPALLRHARTIYGGAMRGALDRAGFDDIPANGLYVIGGLAVGVVRLTERGTEAAKIQGKARDAVDAKLAARVSAEDIAAARRVLYALVEMGIEAREREPASS
jgi:hypothetical protein